MAKRQFPPEWYAHQAARRKLDHSSKEEAGIRFELSEAENVLQHTLTGTPKFKDAYKRYKLASKKLRSFSDKKFGRIYSDIKQDKLY